MTTNEVATITPVSISISYAGATAAATVTLTPPVTLASMLVTPTNALSLLNSTLNYAVVGIYSDGSTQNLTAASVIWSSTNTTAAGVATGVASGSTTIQAALGAITGSTGLIVTTTTPRTGRLLDL